MLRHQGKISVVTGAGSGIGLAVAKRLAEEGSVVVLSDFNAELGMRAKEELQEVGEVRFVRADIRDGDEVKNLFAQILEEFGRLDCACNNAGIMFAQNNVENYAEAEWDNVINTNLKGVWLCLQQEISMMLMNGGGTIVNIASTFGIRGGDVDPAYIASKHGVVGLTQALGVRYAQKNVRVNAVCPGAIDTPMFDLPSWHAADLKKKLARVPMSRLGTAKEIAAAASWLCCSESSFITGTTLVADGGLLAC